MTTPETKWLIEKGVPVPKPEVRWMLEATLSAITDGGPPRDPEVRQRVAAYARAINLVTSVLKAQENAPRRQPVWSGGKPGTEPKNQAGNRGSSFGRGANQAQFQWP